MKIEQNLKIFFISVFSEPMVMPTNSVHQNFLRKPLRKNMETALQHGKESELPQLTQWTH